MKRRINFLGFLVDNLTTHEILTKIKASITSKDKMQIVPINANKIYQVQRNEKLSKIMKESELIIPEYAIVWGSKIIGAPLVEHVGGIMLMRTLLQESANQDFRFYFLGARQEIVETMVEKVAVDYPGIRIAGWRNGYFDDQNKIIDEINATDANILLAALGTPKQEYFLYENKSRLKPNVMMGVGGSFDVFAGLRQETPAYLRHGFEWLYRLAQDPGNLWKRYMTTNPYFVYRVLRYRVFGW
ncbi:MAG: WecB/TagA/CpsF family glycosyltransferase [Candidatus Lokiarchaeota archaeon]|nr:WecB/TagA/CpsF family glycosyltransferase [Candidatus Lokiarchaeota archaeon]